MPRLYVLHRDRKIYLQGYMRSISTRSDLRKHLGGDTFLLPATGGHSFRISDVLAEYQNTKAWGVLAGSALGLILCSLPAGIIGLLTGLIITYNYDDVMNRDADIFNF